MTPEIPEHISRRARALRSAIETVTLVEVSFEGPVELLDLGDDFEFETALDEAVEMIVTIAGIADWADGGRVRASGERRGTGEDPEREKKQN